MLQVGAKSSGGPRKSCPVRVCICNGREAKGGAMRAAVECDGASPCQGSDCAGQGSPVFVARAGPVGSARRGHRREGAGTGEPGHGR